MSTRGARPHIVRAGRAGSIKDLAKACNADAERMRREAAERAGTAAAAPVVIPQRKTAP